MPALSATSRLASQQNRNPDRIPVEVNLNIQAQLDELRHLENGWFDGDGLAPSLEGLDWLTTQFTADHYDALPRP